MTGPSGVPFQDVRPVGERVPQVTWSQVTEDEVAGRVESAWGYRFDLANLHHAHGHAAPTPAGSRRRHATSTNAGTTTARARPGHRTTRPGTVKEGTSGTLSLNPPAEF